MIGKFHVQKSTVITVLLSILIIFSARGSENQAEKVGLVLSGGGAKGIAHVGVIKALEDNDIPIDYVAGTSMGAIVGSLYSCGWSPGQMMDLFTSQDFLDWSKGQIPTSEIYYYIQPDPTPKWLEVNVNFKEMGKITNQILPSSLVSPLPLNIEFLKLYGPYTEQCGENFNNLFVPFRCVTSDIYHKHKVVLKDGSLSDAVRASMSFPLVYRPIKLNGILMYDGGIYDNFPVNVMENDFHPEFVIGVSVSNADSAPIQGDIYSQLEDMIIQNNDYSVPADKGVKIQVPVTNFGVLSFDKAKTIYDIGYRTGLSMVDSIKSRISSRRSLEAVTEHRKEFAASTPELVFDSLDITGANRDQTRYLRFLFDRGHDRPMTIDEVTSSYYRAVTDGTLSNLMPHAIFNKDGHNMLDLAASVKRPWSLGVGGWITSSNNNMLYAQAGFHTLSLNSLDVTLSGWVGQSYYAAMLSGRFTLPTTRIPSFFKVDIVASRQKFYDSDILFYDTSSPAFITEQSTFIRGSYVMGFNREWKGTASLAWGYMGDSYFSDTKGNYAERKKDHTYYRMGVGKFFIEKNSLNDDMYPSAGEQIKAGIAGGYELSKYRPGDKVGGDKNFQAQWWGSLEFLWKKYYKISRRFKVGAMGNVLATLRPLNQNYTSTLVHFASFGPTPSTKGYFNEAFRSDNYLAAGVIPMWTPISGLQLRGDFYVYAPMRHLKNNGKAQATYDGWFKTARFIGEAAVVYNFPFASLSAYCNYLSFPARNWNFGINFGLYFQAPKLLHD